MAKAKGPIIANLADLVAYEASIDEAICGLSLGDERESRFAAEGANDLAPTHYFMLEELFSHVAFDEDSHLLDVGCGVGRVLAFFLREGLPGRATGVELDPQLADFTRAWTKGYDNIDVIQASALELDLSAYTHLYLFNPFTPDILQQFIECIEAQIPSSCTVIHMSDNGDTWRYVGRPGWTELASGTIQSFKNARGYQIKIYDCAQHYTIWRYDAEV